jgi:hypothetical protein
MKARNELYLSLGSGRRNMAYRFNLLFHIGETSTVRDLPWSILKEVMTAERNGGAQREREFDHLYLFLELVCSISIALEPV